MAQRNVIEETFRVIAPSRQRGIPNPPPIAAGIGGSGGELNTSLSQAAQEISQLRAAWQQQAQLIAANTNALQNSGQGGHSAAGTAGQVASGALGGALGFLSPVAKGLLSLFGGGGSSGPAPLPVYVPPPPVNISGVVRSASAPNESQAQPSPFANAAPAANTTSTSSGGAQITVNINAMDSQSFLDRSHDIASAVRLAMLNLHPINDVVADL